MKRKLFTLMAIGVAASMILAACGAPQEVVKTVVVTEVVEGEVVERVVTATPEAAGPMPVTVHYNWGTEPPTAD
ncbi:MAG TPA: hypothetical protein ENL35_03365, partial [Chloroflexi bacterium]|nr:hypothetical protein [Chloroflexota bacterium]